MLAESGLPAEVKERSIAVFTALGEAEAKTHGSTLDKVGNVSVAFRRFSRVGAGEYVSAGTMTAACVEACFER